MAFQLQDDILDVYGESGKVGKTNGGDILSNKKTILLLQALALASNYQKEELQNWMNVSSADARAKVEGVKALYDALDVRRLAVAEMRKYFDKGIAELESIDALAAKKDVLREWVEGLMGRER